MFIEAFDCSLVFDLFDSDLFIGVIRVLFLSLKLPISAFQSVLED